MLTAAKSSLKELRELLNVNGLTYVKNLDNVYTILFVLVLTIRHNLI